LYRKKLVPGYIVQEVAATSFKISRKRRYLVYFVRNVAATYLAYIVLEVAARCFKISRKCRYLVYFSRKWLLNVKKYPVCVASLFVLSKISRKCRYLVYIVLEVAAKCFKISRKCLYLVYFVQEVAANCL
jgi:hypothetical protein